MKFKKFLTLILVLLIGASLPSLYRIYKDFGQKADTAALKKLLEESSDLITAKLNITGMTEYKDKGIKILNRSDFVMVYKAEIKAGIDIKNIEISADDSKKTINITIPKSQIISTKVDPANIKYFDEKFSLFNPDPKQDASAAVSLAEEDVKKEAINTGILELADKQAATLTENLISKAVPKNYK